MQRAQALPVRHTRSPARTVSLRRQACVAALALLLPIAASAAALKALVLDATGGVSLQPAFTPTIADYRVQVQSDIATVLLRATPAEEGAAVTVTVNGQATDPKDPMRVPLAVGSNSVVLRVTGKGGGETVQLRIEREDIAPVAALFRKATFTDPAGGAAMPYRLFVPKGADTAAPGSIPLVVFLHGGGERGSDNEVTLTANQGPTIWAKPEEQAKRPAYVLVPQARAQWDGGFGITRNAENKISLERVFQVSDDLKTAQKLLAQVLVDHPGIDRKRLYLTGLSQGGFGAWNWNLAQPELFAAFVAICGGADPAQVAVLKNKPVWAFHAAADPVIPVDYSRKAVAALKAAGGNVQYTEYDSATYFHPIAHFSWVPAFQSEAMREWLFRQTR